MRHQLSSLFEKNSTFVSQLHRRLVSQQERYAKVLFQSASLTAQRLRDVQVLRRLAEVRAFRNRNKLANVAQLHRRSFYTFGGRPKRPARPQ
jgi:hypothetical protein